MASNKEKNEEKNQSSSQENQEETTDKSNGDENDSKSDSKSNASDNKGENDIKSLEGQKKKLQEEISTLQKEVNEIKEKDIKTQLKEALGLDEDENEDIDPVEALTERISSLENQIQEKDRELAKSSYIDSLDVSDTVKRELKRRVSVDTDNIEEAVEGELEAINELLQNSTPKTTDTRPYSVGDMEVDSADAKAILEAEGEKIND